MHQNAHSGNHTTGEAIRLSQVQYELDCSDKAICCLKENVALLRNRLQSVLKHPNKGETAPSPGVPQPMLVPLADAMRGRNQQLDGLNIELAELLALLDL